MVYLTGRSKVCDSVCQQTEDHSKKSKNQKKQNKQKKKKQDTQETFRAKQQNKIIQ